MRHVVADHRERGSRTYDLLCGDSRVCLEVARLTVGDYLLDRRVIVERKTLDDFMISVIDARLFRQANRLCRASQPAVIVLEGTTTTRRTGLGREQIQGALLTLSLVFGLPVLRSRDPQETVWLFRAIARQANRRVAKGLASRHWNPRDTDARRIHVLASCPGIGPERAERLLNHFGTLAAVFTATESALRGIEGLGPQTATTLHHFFHRPTPTHRTV